MWGGVETGKGKVKEGVGRGVGGVGKCGGEEKREEFGGEV